jgi:hypothetical protein
MPTSLSLLNRLKSAAPDAPDWQQPDFDPQTWLAFTRFALDGLSAADVARELAISVSKVVQAKFRVLKRLREEADGLTG